MIAIKRILSALAAVAVTAAFANGKSTGFRCSRPDIDLSEAWDLLKNFYGSDMPEVVMVELREFSDGNSKFNCATNTIFINAKLTEKTVIQSLAAHEGSHIALCRVTKQLNTDSTARFWDEGLATIFEYRLLGKDAEYKASANQLARKQFDEGKLNFSDLFNWYSYSRDAQGKINGYAYGVGSSFDYFLIENFGEQMFRSFLTDIGQSKEFSTSVMNIFGLSVSDLRQQWLNYVQSPPDGGRRYKSHRLLDRYLSINYL
jgi:hypothetical protein